MDTAQASAPATRNNLPLQLTSFVGREREIAEVRRLFATSRLLTLTGAGGSGKTRLALRVAAELASDFANGVGFVDLAPIREAGLVLTAIAQTLGVQEAAGRSLLEGVKDHLRPKARLLVLDNFEQVLEAAPLVTELLASAEGLKVLTTSRAALHVRGEQEYPLPPLDVPGSEPTATPDRLLSNEAVRLFVERARAARPDFALTGENASAVAEICRRLDGLPLAIELAGARVKLLDPEAMLPLLQDRLRLLTGGARDLPARQQTLRAAITWSYDLLDSGEKALFQRLGVFTGGWSLEAAEAVCNPAGELDVLERMASLVDKSLVRKVEGTIGVPRFTMLETVREFAAELLDESGENELLLRRHAQFYRRLAEDGERGIQGRDQVAWVGRLDADQDNLRAALGWSLAIPSGAETGLRLAGSLWWHWYQRGRLSEGCTSLEAAVAAARSAPLAPEQSLVARALTGAAFLRVFRSEYEAAENLAREAISIAGDCDDLSAQGLARIPQGMILLFRGEFETPRADFHKSVELARNIGDRWLLRVSLLAEGRTAHIQGDDTAARDLHEEALAICRAEGDWFNLALALSLASEVEMRQGNLQTAQEMLEEALELAQPGSVYITKHQVLRHLGHVAILRGDFPQAVAHLTEGLNLAIETGYRYGALCCAAEFAAVAASAGRVERAVRLGGTVRAHLSAMGTDFDSVARAAYGRLHVSARRELSVESIAELQSKGKSMTFEETLEEARLLAAEVLQELSAPAGPDVVESSGRERPTELAGLTERELDVLRLAAQGLTSAQVAEQLVISPVTVSTHLRNIYSKLGVNSRSAATRWAVEHGIG